jgi:hypothetical protein
MFNLKSGDRSASNYADLSQILEEEHHWSAGILRSFEYLLNTSAFAIEPLSGLLAIGIFGYNFIASGCSDMFSRHG